MNEGLEKRRELSLLVISSVTFALGIIIGLIFSRCPSERKTIRIGKEFPSEKTTPVKEEKVRIFIEGKPIMEFFPSHITIYKAEVTTFQIGTTCITPKFSPFVIEAPPKYINSRTVDVIFSPGLLFTCKTENFEFPCGVNSNRLRIEYLEDGPKTFEVKYLDETNCEVDVIKISFIVDTEPPETKIISVGFSELITSPDATFRFEVNEEVKTILCKVDDGFWMDCSGGSISLSNLEEGWHRISAYSIDLAGNEEKEVKEHEFRVDARPPVSFLLSAPPSITNSTEAVFEFDADEDDVRFECNLNELGWVSCSSPYRMTDMKAGLYKFKLRSIDSFGRVEQEPLVYSWTIVDEEIKGDYKPFTPPRQLTKVRKYRKKEKKTQNSDKLKDEKGKTEEEENIRLRNQTR